MVGVQVEAAPLERGLRCALKKLARRIAEELRHVDALDLPLRCSDAATGFGRHAPEEVGEEIVEQAAAAAEAAHPLLGYVNLAEILDLLRPVRAEPHSRRDRRPSVPLTTGLFRHLGSPLSRGAGMLLPLTPGAHAAEPLGCDPQDEARGRVVHRRGRLLLP